MAATSCLLLAPHHDVGFTDDMQQLVGQEDAEPPRTV
jgi:hypothetical protein